MRRIVRRRWVVVVVGDEPAGNRPVLHRAFIYGRRYGI
jgi:hypothetical protein